MSCHFGEYILENNSVVEKFATTFTAASITVINWKLLRGEGGLSRLWSVTWIAAMRNV